MNLRSVPKGYTAGMHREIPPAKTLELVSRVKEKAGITRVAEITGLDRIGIPIFTSIRPMASQGAVTVYTGKGYSQEEAEVSAIMEGIERFSAEPRGLRLVRGSYKEISRDREVLDPNLLILPRRYQSSEEIEWVEGHSLTRDATILVPAEAVFHPYSRHNQLFRTNTNGLAVGNALEEAIVHGLMEVIERDAWSLFEAGRLQGRDLDLSGCGSPMVRAVLEKLEKAGIGVYAKEITSDVGIPTVAVAIDDELTKDPALLSLGVGTHLMAEIAAVRALTEAVQSRLTTIHGTREDTVKAEFARRIGYERMKRINRKWFAPCPERVSLDELRSFSGKDFLEDIRYTIEGLGRAGLREVIVVDLTRGEIGVPAVRVIVPGLEVYALDKERAGRRLSTYSDKGH
ncbi:MAG: YcaO-related McrA-glycine thioamidation protein [Candidatus Methanosuratincola sp.]|jgi:ribosomal protein S12 methylthiotransferase accessory factor|nr:YcaO-related McrA-glycine thioamidation protein [Candidatus Methanosuratincola sp.]